VVLKLAGVEMMMTKMVEEVVAAEDLEAAVIADMMMTTIIP
jgi:nucleoside recognition membrane protein YjiH